MSDDCNHPPEAVAEVSNILEIDGRTVRGLGVCECDDATIVTLTVESVEIDNGGYDE